MAEYIEREAAIAAAFTASAIGNTAYRDVYDTVNRLRLIPAADVDPVRHGRWNVGTWGWECSECAIETNNTYPVCPYCGARMDGSEP